MEIQEIGLSRCLHLTSREIHKDRHTRKEYIDGVLVKSVDLKTEWRATTTDAQKINIIARMLGFEDD